MKRALEIIEKAFQDYNPVVSFSGGTDSMVLLDLIYRHTAHRPPILFADSYMEYPETLPFIHEVCRHYGARLILAKPRRAPQEQWAKSGWPMLGKMAARNWTRKYARERGFKLDVSSCCRTMKIAPARRAARDRGYNAQLTGVKGQVDDSLRGLRALKDGAIKYVKADKITIINPLTGWTDTMAKRYTRQNRLMQHPAKAQGAVTIGCMFCGGGSQFTNSGYRVLRQTSPRHWWRFMVDYRGGEIILALKYGQDLETIRAAIQEAGGLQYLAQARPWIFDYTTKTPAQGYQK